MHPEYLQTGPRAEPAALAGGQEALLAVNAALRDRVHELKTQIKQTELLLREARHRVKNDLQTASSLLLLQARREPDAAVGRKLEDGAHRIQSLAALHESFDRRPNAALVDGARYLRDLVRRLQAFHSSKERPIRMHLEAATVPLPAPLAACIGLVVNEIVTNSCKHAFGPGDAGDVRVALHDAPDQLILVIADNGRGLPVDFAARRTISFGITMVQDMLKHHGGTLEVATDARGTCWTAFLPKPDRRKAPL